MAKYTIKNVSANEALVIEAALYAYKERLDNEGKKLLSVDIAELIKKIATAWH